MDEKVEEKKFAKTVLEEITIGKINSLRDLDIRQFELCKQFKLKEVPARPFILSFAKKPTKKMLEILSIKPTRSLSGVQVIAVMLPPFDCPGECTYCPSQFEDKIAPKSYTGFEPSTMRAQRHNYDPYKIVANRIEQLDATGNYAEKIELIFQGSSFTVLGEKRQKSLIKKSVDAVIGKKQSSFEKTKLVAEKSKRRVVGITFETRPDYCTKKDIKRMLNLGGTRVELGVQNPSDTIYKKIKRGHSVKDVVNSTMRLKDSSFKVLYHLMPGLPGSDYKTDLANFRKIFSSQDFKPDMVKFYPCLVIKGSELYADWKKGNFNPLLEKEAIKLLSSIKSEIPRWVRIMRVNRDIPSNIISAGIKKTNLRQLVEKEMESHGQKCNCIRCREIGLKKKEFDISKAKIKTEFYKASKGEEAFISLEHKDDLFGFVRVRKPHAPFLKSITPDTALVRELHVYGKTLSLGKKEEDSAQHHGLGKELMLKAEEIAKEKFGAKKMVVISGLGVKPYYKKNLNYVDDSFFVSKKL
ncbi:MAG: tRNA uridine(34) 5-carboxymethylaminomethyl modification radical SAM/GNAT enzyme Elp3 [Candidatus Diapherotrites archaeon]|jgi:elongator complex protein 3|uniref:tRNA carboxymethyluridine synthase n=1 Tax=Candidatus Iainarchaeum sp. TaxID=3101447 RepID=A0A8T5GH59_9ARCH|nr:tRNA uridine(34) 5-carboxymethylaminomethyl modification radical SAM/GNAT enzyme Elp3 [Candidatus Diapherotrites archaeon]MBT7241379.1 tRNA uridine(34) 5-carboxymethylaminomethyl modification radical SAM/GNAT enzyme Elp3 [Candidatus Diapherotrites archaeon]